MVGAMLVQQVIILICGGATRTSRLGFAAGSRNGFGRSIESPVRSLAGIERIRKKPSARELMVRLGKTPRSA